MIITLPAGRDIKVKESASTVDDKLIINLLELNCKP
jgi:hypothetical protein